MKTFKDVNGQDWMIVISTSSVKRTRDLAQIDLLAIVDEKADLLERLYTDPFTLHAALYGLCKPQCDERKLTDEQFGDALASGDVMEAALTALMRDLADFFRPATRNVLQKILVKIGLAETKVEEILTRKVDEIDVEKTVESQLRNVGGSSSSEPPSLASSPGT